MTFRCPALHGAAERHDLQPAGVRSPVHDDHVDQTRTIPLEWESIEKALDMERGEERVEQIYLKPAIAYLRQELDSYCAQFAYQNTNMVTGALGTNPTTFDATSAACKQALEEMGCPDGYVDLGLMLPPAVARAVKTANIGCSIRRRTSRRRSAPATTARGRVRLVLVELAVHAHGGHVGGRSVTVNGAGQSGSTIVVTCTTGDTFNKGDKVSIANVNQVNLMTRRTTSTATAGTKTFTITARRWARRAATLRSTRRSTVRAALPERRRAAGEQRGADALAGHHVAVGQGRQGRARALSGRVLPRRHEARGAGGGRDLPAVPGSENGHRDPVHSAVVERAIGDDESLRHAVRRRRRPRGAVRRLPGVRVGR
jgi:hypothetical protein